MWRLLPSVGRGFYQHGGASPRPLKTPMGSTSHWTRTNGKGSTNGAAGGGAKRRQRRGTKAKGGRTQTQGARPAHEPRTRTQLRRPRKLRKISPFAKSRRWGADFAKGKFCDISLALRVSRAASKSHKQAPDRREAPSGEHTRRPQPVEICAGDRAGQARAPARNQPVDARPAAAKPGYQSTSRRIRRPVGHARSQAPETDGSRAQTCTRFAAPTREHAGKQLGRQPRPLRETSVTAGRSCCVKQLGAARRQRQTDNYDRVGLGAQGGRVAVCRKNPPTTDKHNQTAAGAPGPLGCSTCPRPDEVRGDRSGGPPPSHVARRRHATDRRARAGEPPQRRGRSPHPLIDTRRRIALGVGLRHTPKGSDLCQCRKVGISPKLTVFFTQSGCFSFVFFFAPFFLCFHGSAYKKWEHIR